MRSCAGHKSFGPVYTLRISLPVVLSGHSSLLGEFGLFRQVAVLFLCGDSLLFIHPSSSRTWSEAHSLAWEALVVRGETARASHTGMTGSFYWSFFGVGRSRLLGCFDSTMGYPGEGPRRQKLPQHERPQVVLAKRRVSLAASERRTVLLGLFADWLRDHNEVAIFDLLKEEGKVVSRYLAHYGQFLYDRGDPVGVYVDSILAVVDQERSLRRFMTAAWDVADSWKLLMPWSNHVPTPPTMLLAMFSLSVIWGWPDMGIFILLAFNAMLRPGELLKLTRSDVLLPSDLLSAKRVIYVRLREPKNRRITARREHVKVEDSIVVDLLELWLPRLRPEQPLFPMKAENMRKYHDSLVTFFGVPAADGLGLTPASHRGGGATWTFEQTGDLDLTRWRGRWAATSRTLEVYIQEVAAASVLPALDAVHRQRILAFAQAAPLLWNDLARQLMLA